MGALEFGKKLEHRRHPTIITFEADGQARPLAEWSMAGAARRFSNVTLQTTVRRAYQTVGSYLLERQTGFSFEQLFSPSDGAAVLQDALRELQDPATQSRVKAMMEDPAFQESMKAYMEQITKDPQFDALKKQTEEMMQDPAFVEQMTKTFADMGAAMPSADKEDE